MNCPSCGTKSNSNICPMCGADNVLYNKTNNISDVLYNKGLAQSKDNDLSGAIVSLNKSLHFNKNNYLAHNVLGLVYFECGRAGDAIKQWVISFNIKKEEHNLARGYIKVFEENAVIMEKMNDSIKLYNQALTYIKRKNEDMAIIRLKKAIELNPNFIDALNLLSFCYLITKENKKAISTIERALEIDINNPTALSYFRELGLNRVRPQNTERTRIATGAGARETSTAAVSRIGIGENKTFGNSFGMKWALFFSAGSILSFVIIFLLLVPAVINGKDKQIAQMSDVNSQKEQSYNETISAKNKEIDDLTLEKDALQKQKNALDIEVEKQSRTQKILTSSAVLQGGDYEGAAALLENLNPDGLSDDTIELYNSIVNSTYSRIEKESFNEGIRLYNLRRYEEAKTYFEKTVKYMTEDSRYTGDSLYYLGRIAEMGEDTNAAKVYYEKVLNDYPAASQANRAKNQLNQLE